MTGLEMGTPSQSPSESSGNTTSGVMNLGLEECRFACSNGEFVRIKLGIPIYPGIPVYPNSRFS